jgi:phage terminase small subunit
MKGKRNYIKRRPVFENIEENQQNPEENINNSEEKPEKNRAGRTKLTPREELFCIEYAKSGGLTAQAYKKAYCNNCSHNSSRVEGWRLLHNPMITQRINDLMSIQKQSLETQIYYDKDATIKRLSNLIEEAKRRKKQIKITKTIETQDKDLLGNKITKIVEEITEVPDVDYATILRYEELIAKLTNQFKDQFIDVNNSQNIINNHIVFNIDVKGVDN